MMDAQEETEVTETKSLPENGYTLGTLTSLVSCDLTRRSLVANFIGKILEGKKFNLDEARIEQQANIIIDLANRLADGVLSTTEQS